MLSFFQSYKNFKPSRSFKTY